MFIPIIPIVAWICAGTGLSTLVWYYMLSGEEKEAADRKAAELSVQLYGKSVEALADHEKRHVQNRVKAYFCD